MISINSNFHCQLSCFHQGWKYFSFIYRTPILHLDGNTHFLELLKIKFCFARMRQHMRGHSNIRVTNKVASGVNIKKFFLVFQSQFCKRNFTNILFSSWESLCLFEASLTDQHDLIICFLSNLSQLCVQFLILSDLTLKLFIKQRVTCGVIS